MISPLTVTSESMNCCALSGVQYRLGSCDDIETIYDDEVRADAGAITAPAMRRVEAGLRAALGMTELRPHVVQRS